MTARPIVTEVTTENERIARRVPEDIATPGNLDRIEEVFAGDAVEHGPFGQMLRGPDAIAEDIRRLRDAFPDLTVTVEDAVTEGDTVAFRATMRGTNKGRFMGRDPTNQSVQAQNTVFTRIESGRIAERWVQPDTLGLLRQLGVVSLPDDLPPER